MKMPIVLLRVVTSYGHDGGFHCFGGTYIAIFKAEIFSSAIISRFRCLGTRLRENFKLQVKGLHPVYLEEWRILQILESEG
jgi:hypothetical protein